MGVAKYIKDEKDAIKEVIYQSGIKIKPVYTPQDLEDVGFEYEPGQPVLNNVNLEVEAGQFIAIVGPSGAGKSTITGMLSRLHDPVTGGVLIDGVDIRDFTLDSLRTQISVVLQDTLLFATSIRENIAFGAPDSSEEEIISAARLAHAHEFISALPQAYETKVGERGVTLSVGQRQRIAVARAALRKAPILILDEPATGLDPENRQALMLALEKLSRQHTTFLITHEMRDIRGADRVFKVINGGLAELTANDLAEIDGEP